MSAARRASRIACATLFALAGTMHFVVPDSFVAIVPDALPNPEALVAISGALEIAGGIGLLIPRLRRAASIGLIALLVFVFPANILMAINQETVAPDVAAWLLWARLPLQPLLAWWVWRVGWPAPPRAAAPPRLRA